MSLTINPKAKASSHKIYLDGPGGMRVPARQIHLTDSTSFQVYDTSGPHSDPGLVVDVRYGLAPLRDGWIRSRGDVEELAQPTSAYRRERLAQRELDDIRFTGGRKPLRAKAGRTVTQMHYAR